MVKNRLMSWQKFIERVPLRKECSILQAAERHPKQAKWYTAKSGKKSQKGQRTVKHNKKKTVLNMNETTTDQNPHTVDWISSPANQNCEKWNIVSWYGYGSKKTQVSRPVTSSRIKAHNIGGNNCKESTVKIVETNSSVTYRANNLWRHVEIFGKIMTLSFSIAAIRRKKDNYFNLLPRWNRSTVQREWPPLLWSALAIIKVRSAVRNPWESE